MIKHFIGIDPGKSGAIAVLHESGRIKGFQKLSETEWDIYEFLSEYDNYLEQNSCMLEAVHAMPGQGVASTFKFGQSYGFLRGLITGMSDIPYETVTPAKWQGYMGCRSKGDKNVTKAKAQELFPGQKITHAIADALLIAEYARRTHV